MAVSLCLVKSPPWSVGLSLAFVLGHDQNSAQGGKKLKVMLLVKETGESIAGFSVHKD